MPTANLPPKEAASAAAAWGSSLTGAAIQSYGVGALLNASATTSSKGAAYLGLLVFSASAAPSVCLWPPCFPASHLANHVCQIISQFFTEKRPLDTFAVGIVSRVAETVGLALVLNYWGTRTNPFS